MAGADPVTVQGPDGLLFKKRLFTWGHDVTRSISVNGTPTPVGGCQFEIENGDQVAFTWTSF
ncbi:hypothetical protein M5362_03530 [Streptomyces sp. Je 1-79]|uniref:hypothetical protein n=1 Tax=Streptomyces sp. Je 1-79 TaxID=2943847 RepID=UPI0021A7EFDB|nr:hypothetical protein [Streptomyces sp. Je 1-79]MCT4352201.1 hypothetical protein [Streptomyces sp. Je 1-79]